MRQDGADTVGTMSAQIVVVMGVSGVGKSTVAKGISTHLGCEFAEGDAFHPQANIDKMHAGHALDDDDRWPWLRSLRDWMADEIASGRSAVVTCSALKRSYRDLLREAGETLSSMGQGGIIEADLTDRASVETDRALELRTRDRARKLISKIDMALERIENGTYGYCEETGEPIGLGRLIARPIATMTVEAQEAHERREKISRDM